MIWVWMTLTWCMAKLGSTKGMVYCMNKSMDSLDIIEREVRVL